MALQNWTFVCTFLTGYDLRREVLKLRHGVMNYLLYRMYILLNRFQ